MSALPAGLGRLRGCNAVAVAERALRIAATTENARFMLGLDVAGELYVGSYAHVPASEWLASFTKQSDPDWLAEQIEFARGIA